MNVYLITYPVSPDGTRKVSSGCSAELFNECGTGFIFCGFKKNSSIYTIPATAKEFTDEELIRWCNENDRNSQLKSNASIRKEIHIKLVEDAIKFVKSTEKTKDVSSKVVASRIKKVETKIIIPALYRNLVKAYPDACVFLFSTSQSGTWIGASPELLCSIHHSGDWQLNTMALAGTRPADTGGEWDDKNICEQAMVTEYILSSLKSLKIEAVKGETFTKKAGEIEHLCTPITAKIDSSRNFVDSSSRTDNLIPFLVPILKKLSPTPALCGYPQKEAMDFIISHESFARDFYGGFIGTVSPYDSAIYVNLRCGRFLPNGEGILLYAGGGITRDSNSEKEWEETERKLSTLMTFL